MERLTNWNGKKWVLPHGKGAFRRIAEKLAAYENTGLNPEQLAYKYLKNKKDFDSDVFPDRLTGHSDYSDTPVPNLTTIGDVCTRIEFCDDYNICEDCPIGMMINRLCEYEDTGITPAGIEFLKGLLR